MTADELVQIARKGRPNVRYTRNVQGTAVAAWLESESRWVTVAGFGCDGKWYSVGDLYIDGQPVNKPSDWMPEGV